VERNARTRVKQTGDLETKPVANCYAIDLVSFWLDLWTRGIVPAAELLEGLNERKIAGQSEYELPSLARFTPTQPAVPVHTPAPEVGLEVSRDSGRIHRLASLCGHYPKPSKRSYEATAANS